MSETYKPGDRIKITLEGTVHSHWGEPIEDDESDEISVLLDNGDRVDIENVTNYLDNLDIVRVKPDLKAQISALDTGTAVFLKHGIDNGFTYLIDHKQGSDETILRNHLGGYLAVASLDNDRIHELRVLT